MFITGLQFLGVVLFIAGLIAITILEEADMQQRVYAYLLSGASVCFILGEHLK